MKLIQFSHNSQVINQSIFCVFNFQEDTKTQGYFNMMTGLKRILAFSKNHEMTDWDVYEDINSIIEHGAKGNVDDEV